MYRALRNKLSHTSSAELRGRCYARHRDARGTPCNVPIFASSASVCGQNGHRAAGSPRPRRRHPASPSPSPRPSPTKPGTGPRGLVLAMVDGPTLS